MKSRWLDEAAWWKRYLLEGWQLMRLPGRRQLLNRLGIWHLAGIPLFHSKNITAGDGGVDDD